MTKIEGGGGHDKESVCGGGEWGKKRNKKMMKCWGGCGVEKIGLHCKANF